MEDSEVSEVSDYVYTNYPQSKEELSLFLKRYRDNLIVLRNGSIIGVAFYLKLEDDTLRAVSGDCKILQDIYRAEELMSERGRNIHFIRVIAEDYKVVLKGLKEVILKENPKTVSWYKEDMDKIKFIKFRS